MRASEEFGFGGGPRRWASEIHPQGGELVSQARDQQPEIWARFGLRPETVVSISPLAPVAQEAVASYTHSDLDIRAQGIGIPGVLARYINRRTSACKTSLRRGAESVNWGGEKSQTHNSRAGGTRLELLPLGLRNFRRNPAGQDQRKFPTRQSRFSRIL